MLTAKQYLDVFNADIKKTCQPYVEGLNKQEAEKHLLELAAKSLDIRPKAVIKCDCGKEVIGEITHLHTVTEDLFYDLGKIKIEFKYPNIDLSEDAVEQFLECIDYVVIDDNIIKWSNVDEDHMNILSEYFTFEFMQGVLNKLNANIYTIIPFNCSCGNNFDRTITGFNNLIDYYKV